MPAKLIIPPGSDPTNESERLVIHTLHQTLPGTYIIIANFELKQSGAMPSEYDGVVIAPHAIYVIETKGYKGQIEGDDYRWRINKRYVDAPLATTNKKARILKTLIRDKVAGLSDVWVEPLIILSDDQVQLKLSGTVRGCTVRLADAADHLRDKTRLANKAADLKKFQTRIAEVVERAYAGRLPQARQFGDYVVVETLMQTDNYTEYLAKRIDSVSKKLFRLRVFAYNPYADTDARERRKAQIQREAETLEQLGTHPNLTMYRTCFTDTTDPNLYITVTDYAPESRTLRDELLDGARPLAQILSVARDVAAGLDAAHSQQIYHRDVRPDNIQIEKDGRARLVNFDYAKITGVIDKTTVLPRDPETGSAYLPPEWLDPSVAATPQGDLYSLGMVLFEMAVGTQLVNAPADALGGTTRTGEPNSYLDTEKRLPDALNTLIARMIHPDPARRPESAREVSQVIAVLLTPPQSEPVSSPTSQTARTSGKQPKMPAVFDIDDMINEKYVVQQVLDAGSSGRVYKVHDRFADQVYALKVFHDSSLSEANVMTESKALQAISQHRHIVSIRDVIVLRDGRYAIVSEFVDGDTLDKFIARDTPIAIKTVLQLMVQLLDALDHMHQREWIHRDVKPSNVIYSSDGIRLIDFNIAARSDQVNKTHIGTPGYILPNVQTDGWTYKADLFAAGVILYQLVTGHHPYPDGRVTRDADRIDPRAFPSTSNLGKLLVDLLLKSVSISKGFDSAAKFRKAVESVLKSSDKWFAPSKTDEALPLSLSPGEVEKPNYNHYVTRFLRLFSQASRDNSGTRGLDLIAMLTYADTLLDTKLKEAVLRGEYRLVIITGNAGDGKTAFIQQVEVTAQEMGAHYTRLNPNAARFTLNNIEFQTNYDGSQDEEETSNDDVLETFFAPFRDEGLGSIGGKQLVRLIAINQGRLLDFFLDEERQGFSRLARWVDQFFVVGDAGVDNTPPAWLQIVDLNQRSVTAKDDRGESIFSRQIEKFTDARFWSACEGCALKDECFIKYNVDSLRDSAGGSIVVERMRTLFEIVHLRRNLHITMRDLRSALVWMLMRDHDCDAVANVIARNNPAERLRLLYYSAFAADSERAKGGTDDRLVRYLRDIDPALVSNPTLDRTLFERGTHAILFNQFEQRRGLKEIQFTNERLKDLYKRIKAEEGFYEVSRAFNHLLRRVVYYEGRGEMWRSMTPYVVLSEFQAAVLRPDQHMRIMQAIARGISRLEGLLPEEDDDTVYIRAGTETRTRLNSFRAFPMSDFKLHVPFARSHEYAEYTPEHIIFSHISGEADLVLSLDLLEVLRQTADGYVLSPGERQGIYLNYLVFRRALMHLPYTEVLLQRQNGERFKLIQHGEIIVLQAISVRNLGEENPS